MCVKLDAFKPYQKRMNNFLNIFGMFIKFNNKLWGTLMQLKTNANVKNNNTSWKSNNLQVKNLYKNVKYQRNWAENCFTFPFYKKWKQAIMLCLFFKFNFKLFREMKSSSKLNCWAKHFSLIFISLFSSLFLFV